jgi:hypothetical protein
MGAMEDAVKKAQDDEVVAPEWQIVLDCADILRGMTKSLLATLAWRVPAPGPGPGPGDLGRHGL